MSIVFRWVGLALSVLLAQPALAGQINAIISQYSAAEFASAVALFKERHPDEIIDARTPEQLSEMNDASVAEWLHGGATLLAVGVFGPEVERLRPLIEAHRTGDRYIMHSDQELVAMSRIGGKTVFRDREQAIRLGAEKPGEDLVGWVRELGDANPDQAGWIEARSYWIGGGSENIARLLGWLVRRGDPSAQILPPEPRPALRFYQDGRVAEPDELVWRGERLVAVIDHGRADRRGDADLNNALCQTLQQRDMACVSLFAGWGDGTLQALRWLENEEHPPLAAVVVLQDFVLGGGEGVSRQPKCSDVSMCQC